MRALRTLLIIATGLGAACVAQSGTRDPALCLSLFETYDRIAWAFPSPPPIRDNQPIIQPNLERPTRLLRNNGCLTLSSDIDGMPALAQRLAPYTIENSGPDIRPTAVHLGVVLSIYDEGRATAFFRGLGYRSRGVGAAGLGRRLYIGPFSTQGALDQALATARAAGFISPYPAARTRF
jgi:hypothetical protein